MRHKQQRIGTFEKQASTKTHAPAVSWWTAHAQADQFESFGAAAKARHTERVRLDDLREGKKNQAMRHVIDPRAFPPSTREKRR